MIIPVDIPTLAKFILSSDCKRIAVLTGAGISVASGIPDFRSPGGMYETLNPNLLTATEEQKKLMKRDPTYVVSWTIFQENAFPYLEVRRPFILGTNQGKWKATIGHRFIELVHTKTNKLRRLYTQNIDGLDYQCTQIPSTKIVPIHGSIAQVQCEHCSYEPDYTNFCQQVRTNIKNIYKTKNTKKGTTDKQHPEDDSNTPSANDNNNSIDSNNDNNNNNNDNNNTNSNNNDDDDDNLDGPEESIPILCENCNLPFLKPKTVLFGRPIHEMFYDCIEQDLCTLDLLIIAGTSLVVSPANRIVPSVPASTIRVIINNEPVGIDLGIHYNNNNNNVDTNNNDEEGTYRTGGAASSTSTDHYDLFLQGDCDEIFLELIEHLGWLPDVQVLASSGLLPPSSARLVSGKAYTSWF